MAANRSGSRGSVGADFELAGEHVFHAFIVHNNHHQVDGLTSELQTPTAAGDGNWCDRAPPAGLSPARGHSLSMIATETYGDFHHGGNNRDAFRIAHNLVGNALVGRGHDLVEHL